MDSANIVEELSKAEELKPEDFIVIEQYGGGPEECSLSGTKNALRHFALELLKVTAGESGNRKFFNLFGVNSFVQLDSINIAEIRNNKIIYSNSYKQILSDVLGYVFKLFLLLLIVLGLFTLIKYISG